MKYISDKIKDKIRFFFNQDKDIVFNYQRLIFNIYVKDYLEYSKYDYSKEDIIAIKDFCRHCIQSEFKIEAITRVRREMTGKTRGAKGEYFDWYDQRKAAKKVDDVKQELGY